jgi:hypothetical protein
MVMHMSSELAEQVGHLPEAYADGNKSTAQLLLDAGLLEKRRTLSVDEVEDVLKREPRLANLWLKRAKDQRLAGGWSIDCGKDEYRVQNYADGKSVVVRNRLRACAEFIVRYVSFIGDVLTRRSGTRQERITTTGGRPRPAN